MTQKITPLEYCKITSPINIETLEATLVKQWTNFINPKRLMELTTEIVRKHLDTSFIIHNSKQNNLKNQISISRFKIKDNKFIFWTDFTLIIDNYTAIGSMECTSNYENEIYLSKIYGDLYSNNI